MRLTFFDISKTNNTYNYIAVLSQHFSLGFHHLTIVTCLQAAGKRKSKLSLRGKIKYFVFFLNFEAKKTFNHNKLLEPIKGFAE